MAEHGDQLILEQNKALAMEMLTFMDLSSDEEENSRRETAKRIREYQRAMDKLQLSGRRTTKRQGADSAKPQQSLFTGRDISLLTDSEIENIWRPNDEDNIFKFEGRPPANCKPMGTTTTTTSDTCFAKEINRALYGDTVCHPQSGTKAYYDGAQNYATYGKAFMDFPQNLTELWAPPSQSPAQSNVKPMREPPGFERRNTNVTEKNRTLAGGGSGASDINDTTDDSSTEAVTAPSSDNDVEIIESDTLDALSQDNNKQPNVDAATVPTSQTYGLSPHALAYGASPSNVNKRQPNHTAFNLYSTAANQPNSKIGYVQVPQTYVYNRSPTQSYVTARPIATVATANPTLIYTKPFVGSANQRPNNGGGVDMCVLYAQMMQQRYRSPIPHTTHTNQQAAIAAAMFNAQHAQQQHVAAQQAQQQYAAHQAQLHHAAQQAQQQYAVQQQQLAAAAQAAQQEQLKQHDKFMMQEKMRLKLQQQELENKHKQQEKEAMQEKVMVNQLQKEQQNEQRQQDAEYDDSTDESLTKPVRLRKKSTGTNTSSQEESDDDVELSSTSSQSLSSEDTQSTPPK